MPLDKTKLAQDLTTVFTTAADKAWSSEQTAKAIAGAIDDYVKAAVVGGISVNVFSNGAPVGSGSLFGTGAQAGTVNLQ